MIIKGTAVNSLDDAATELARIYSVYPDLWPNKVQRMAMKYLGKNGGATVRQIAESMGRSRHAALQVLDRLIELELVIEQIEDYKAHDIKCFYMRHQINTGDK